MPATELNLVQPTEYEELLARIKLEKNKFETIFEETVKAITDIIFAYGFIQRELFVPGRPLTSEEFLTLSKDGCSFVIDPRQNKSKIFAAKTEAFTEHFEFFFRNLVAFSWNWQNQKPDINKFVKRFYKRLNAQTIYLKRTHGNSYYEYLMGSSAVIYVYCLIPPNFPELLEQVLEHRRQNESKKSKEVQE